MTIPLDLAWLTMTLRASYGPPSTPTPRSAFEWVLWENVAYLADDATRETAFATLRDRVGLTPDAIAHASDEALLAVTRHGRFAEQFAAKLRDVAHHALTHHDGDLDAALRVAFARSPAHAVRLLREYHGVGEPGAERALLFLGLHAALAPESNALRVLARLGAIDDQASYEASYRAARVAVEAGAPHELDALREAHLLLRTHGRARCRRTRPRCDDCTLAVRCAHATHLLAKT